MDAGATSIGNVEVANAANADAIRETVENPAWTGSPAAHPPSMKNRIAKASATPIRSGTATAHEGRPAGRRAPRRAEAPRGDGYDDGAFLGQHGGCGAHDGPERGKTRRPETAKHRGRPEGDGEKIRGANGRRHRFDAGRMQRGKKRGEGRGEFRATTSREKE